MATAHVRAAVRNLEQPVCSGRLEACIDAAASALLDLQHADGHFVFELEADATIPAEYVLMRHYLAEPVDTVLEHKIGVYLRRIQSADGGWPLFHEGASNISASVKGYFALKMIGDPGDAPHMVRARQWILSKGGAATSNVFTRNLLALYGALPWRGVPVVPVEIVLLPRWFPFHIDKISYWARTVLVPLTVLNALKPRARNPKGVRIDELFVTPPDGVRTWPKGPHQKWPWAQLFGGIDRVLRMRRAVLPSSNAQARDRQGCAVCDRAAERRGRPRRHLSGNGELRADVRRLGISAGSPRSPYRTGRARQAADDQGRRGLLPAVSVASVGYGACRAHADRGRRRRRLRRARAAGLNG